MTDILDPLVYPLTDTLDPVEPPRPLFAWVDPAATPAAPVAVRGWFDTDFADYNLPPGAEIVEIDPAAWPDRFATSFWDGSAFVAAPPPVPVPVTQISPSEFLTRFTAAEQQAVQVACLSNPALALGLTVGLALGVVDLASPTVAAWLAGLVAAGAITDARRTVILTPLLA